MANSQSTSPIFSQNRPIHRVALYARVSTLHGQQDPEMQLSELREYAIRRVWIFMKSTSINESQAPRSPARLSIA
jgi:DNA invertase Pin-like site-specific DNA recombinase